MSANALSPAAVVEAFSEQWRASELPAVMPEPVVTPNGDLIELTLIAVYDEHQGNGHGPRALRMLTALCDANAMTIKLCARHTTEAQLARGCSGRLTTEELVAWYGRHGFVETWPPDMPRPPGYDTREMIRLPR